MNPLSTVRAKLRTFLIAWTVIWAAVVVFLWVYWHDLPMSVSWPLAILEAIFVPDLRVLKEHVFKREGAN